MNPALLEKTTGLATEVATLLIENATWQIVFAESCTAGMVSAFVAQTPGISGFLCGSAVTYQEQTKSNWIRVSKDSIAQFTAVSEKVAEEMAIGVLQETDQANIAFSITGHLGPGAPNDVHEVFIGSAVRETNSAEIHSRPTLHLRLKEPTRVDRQLEASHMVLSQLLNVIQSN